MALRPVTDKIAMTLLVEDEGIGIVPSTFRYDPSDAFAVHVAMSAAGCVVDWAFSRDVLADGLRGPAGLGDVHVFPCLDEDGNDTVRMRFGSPEGEAVLEAPAAEIARFLYKTFQVVPQGTEIDHVDFDDVLNGLLAER